MKSQHVKILKKLNATQEEVWQVIGAVNGVEQWFPSMISSCRVAGGHRYCITVDGIEFKEEILLVDHSTCTFKFSIPEQTMLPATNILETVKVYGGIDGTSEVGWEAQFEAREEDVELVKSAFRNIWSLALEELDAYIKEQKLPVNMERKGPSS